MSTPPTKGPAVRLPIWPLLLLGSLVLVAYLLHLLAWYDGRQGRYGLLLLANLLRLPLLLVALTTVLAAIGIRVEKKPDVVTTITGAVLVLLACAGLHALWAVVVAVVAGFVAAEAWHRRALIPSGGKALAARGIVAAALLVLAWYPCASTTDAALRGLGERIDAAGGGDRLRAWAAEVIAAHRAGKAYTHLPREEIPDWVSDLMGNIPGFPFARVSGGKDECVDLANGSGYGYGIRICPSEEKPANSADWGVTWGPGISLYTVSK